MVSIRESVSELELVHRDLDTALASYRSLVAGVAECTAGLDDADTAAVRSSLEEAACSARHAQPEALPKMSSHIRGLLEEYGTRVSTYVANLLQERVRTEKVLNQLASSLTQTDDAHDGRMKQTVEALRNLARSPDARAIRDVLSRAAESIEQSLEKIRREHLETIEQFNKEIRALQRRLGTSEIEDSIENMLRVYTRAEMQEKLTKAQPGQYVLVIVRARGLRLASVQYDAGVAEQLATSLTTRMRDLLPVNTLLGRWAEEAFIGAVPVAPNLSASALCRPLAENLPGNYASTQGSKAVRSYVDVTVCAADTSIPAQVPDRVEASLTRI